MELTELRKQYNKLAQCKALHKELAEKQSNHVFLQGLFASSPAVVISTLYDSSQCGLYLIVLNSQEDAAYFYHDLVQILGDTDVLYFPSAYRRAAKYGQRDDANAILRTEVLSRLSVYNENADKLFVVTSPDALAEPVVSKTNLSENTIFLEQYATVDRDSIQDRLFELGFERVDYVYEPGQYAVRGSILDVFSFSSENPYRIDFFGDDIDSIRQFSVETQLSLESMENAVIVPGMSGKDTEKVSLLDFIPESSVIVARDLLWTADRIESIKKDIDNNTSIAAHIRDVEQTERPEIVDVEDFLKKFFEYRKVEFGTKPTGTPDVTICFNTSNQTLFHKNFDLVSSVLTDYLVKGYKIYILSDSSKQTDRLKAIFEDRGERIVFTPIDKTLHEGFADNLLQCCFFTDHQIFDRFHKYNLKSDRARNGKVALTLKELSEFNIGDYVVHMDHGVGTFGGLVRVQKGGTMQEVIKLIYKNNDVVFVSIHSLHKVSKYKGKEGEPPRINKLGSGAWENLKERTKGKIKDIARDLIQLYAKRSSRSFGVNLKLNF